MKELQNTILDQHARVQSAGENGHTVLSEAKGEIMQVATPDATQDTLDRTSRLTSLNYDTVLSRAPGVRETGSLPRRLAKITKGLLEFSQRSGLIVPNQGYVGLITLDETEKASDVFGFSAVSDQQIQKEDPIQTACGEDFFYPPMMWAKALYSEAYKNRGESQRELAVHEWIAKLVGENLFQGSKPINGGLLGASGFMPSGGQNGMMATLKRSPKRKEHLLAEEVQEFRGSGLMDQACLEDITPHGNVDKTSVALLAGHILMSKGSLN
ncbi:hypothetical protein KC867_00145 [Candidatus Saccharibacteria bacterium]|nr:hypothetical protein [Candidatus Saccharibacteria bacterium]